MAKKRSQPTKPANAIASPDGKPVIAFSTTGKLERWLNKHHAEHGGVWIQFFKKDSGHKSIAYAEALDVALCYGWIDGPVRKGMKSLGFTNSRRAGNEVFGLRSIRSILNVSLVMDA